MDPIVVLPPDPQDPQDAAAGAEAAEPGEHLVRLRVAAKARVTLLQEAHDRLEDDLSQLRSKARS